MIIKNTMIREFISEFLGTMVLTIFGIGASVQGMFSGYAVGGLFPVFWGTAMGVFLGIMISLRVSGGHINPVVTLSLAIWHRHPWNKVIHYMAGQYLGAFIGASLVYGVYFEAFEQFEETKSLMTAGLFATFPGTMLDITGKPVPTFISIGTGIGDQVFGPMLLMLCIAPVLDKNMFGVPPYLIPLYVAFIILGLILCFALNSGAALNPAKDVASRIFIAIAGWGVEPFKVTTSDGVPWWWVPLVAPHVGAIIGVGIYVLLMEIHHPPPQLNRPMNNSHSEESETRF